MRSPELLSPSAKLLLRAISHRGDECVTAYSAWRAAETLSGAHTESHRVLPLLAELVEREGLNDPDLPRMRGVARQAWTMNVLRLRLLFRALDALEGEGITPVLMKGGALFARWPTLERRRVSGDYDILVAPEQLASAADVLRRWKFMPRGHYWEDFGLALTESVTAGVELRLGAQTGIDLHWRPLWNIHDSALGVAYAASAETVDLHGRRVLVPSTTLQLFCAMARCEPWDHAECFARTIEGYHLLTMSAGDVDWQEFRHLTGTYGVESTAIAFLQTLQREAGLATIPEVIIADLSSTVGHDKRREFAIRALPPERRSISQDSFLKHQDFTYRRSNTIVAPPGPREAQLKKMARVIPAVPAIWSEARARLGEIADSDEPVFLEGFSYPESGGRWTLGHWALMVVPLTKAQREGEPLTLNAHAFRGRQPKARIVVAGGDQPSGCVLLDRESELTLAVKLRPLPELHGRGLLLMWLPGADTPAESGSGTDRRQLGAFIRRDWDRRRSKGQSATPTQFATLRQIWRRLPIPALLRVRMAPGVGRIVRSHFLGRLQPPSSPETIGAGDVVLSGFLSDVSGIGRAGRLTREELRHWDAKLVCHDIRRDPMGQTIPASQGGVWICHCNAPEAAHLMLSGTGHIWADRYRIGVWAYELERLPADWRPVLSKFHEIWAPSDFVAEAVRKSAGKTGPIVRVMPHPFSRPPATQVGPERHFAEGRAFKFLTMFDMRSTLMRKNPLGAIRAFQRAFERGSRAAQLTVKVVESGFDTTGMSELARAAAGWPNISFVTERLSDQQAHAMIAEADCLLSLHRSEGFGLTIAEAMSAGTPSIVTGWSAPMEFCEGAALPVAYSLVTPIDPSGRYDKMQARWAEPDLDDAARAMTRLASDQHLWLTLSRTGIEQARRRQSQRWSDAPYQKYLKP